MGLRPYNSVGGFSVGASADQFIDSNRNISAAGATFSGNVSAPNIVNSFNGTTGTVTYAPPLATTSVTGVASFNSSDFTVSTGAVSLTNVARTNATNTFSQQQTFTTGISGNLSLNNYKITDLLTPTNTYDAANKYYVDNIAAGLNYHPNCHVATTVALGATYDNGLTGVGAYLEGLANGFIGQIDGHTADANDRILVKDQTSTLENGIYYVSLTGSASQKWKLIRATDANNSIPGQVAGGDTVYVEEGVTNGGAGFVLIGTSGVGLTLGTSPIVWTQYTGVDVTTAGSGLSKSGNSLNVNVDGSTIQILGDTLQLVNNSATVSAGTGLGGGGSVALGSTVTLSNTGVLSFNSLTGAVSYAPPLATTSVTGVASFNSTYFSVSSGAVSLASAYQVTGDTVAAGTAISVSRSGNVATVTNTGVQSFNSLTGAVSYSPPLATSSVTGVASFGDEFVVSAAGAVSLTGNYVKTVNGVTGAVTIAQGSNVTVSTVGSTITISSSAGGGGSPPLATSSITGVASFGDEFVVSALGAVSLTSNYVKSVNGVTGTPSLTANSASNMTITVQGSNIFVALGISSGTAEPSGGTDGNIYLQYTV
jgi:hypothetical protein